MDDLLIRPLEPWDTDEAAAVWWKARHADAGQLPAAIHTEAEVAKWFAGVLLPDGQTWVALDDGRIVAVLTLDGDDLDQLYVDPAAAGQGIGSTLVDLAKDLRPGGLALWTFQTNTRAQAFYRRHGFTEVRRTDGRANEEKAPDIRMVWGNHPERLESSA
ncbi:GCN5-related N-acetyltransferase [Kribbella flavida DSM 17836]|uniref:GCN5-related N-acetyltransferase n=1 Tax=Kribbella flavida (strain DSM 17836 / JCM 10339 / NBRC 14399) TaxID=479435 RepID=D2PQ70_KRIFD|nr:GNAT family N-acetyltransferase [Kribbella flavida]ADB34772.1 GCN5-related N-acetyltransferase [Kribbella flavida DSM 17836]